MQTNSVITATGTLIAAFIALSGALWATVSNQRQERRKQLAERRHDRRKEAYLAFIAAAREFLPLTETMFLDEERSTIAARAAFADSAKNVTGYAENALQAAVEAMTESWPDSLRAVAFLSEPSEKWYEQTPRLLHDLSAAFDRVDMEGPASVADIALQIVRSAYRQAAGTHLFEAEAEEQSGPEGDGPSSMDMLRVEIRYYTGQCTEFRKQAKAALDSSADDAAVDGGTGPRAKPVNAT
ncbi:hypothetical protein [Streptomyces massasporeus]|uniref:hypothetical protein n=1 Tax=Streptomyces massasporeus TaxID=67324 RepID=UPI00167983DC|nr:hypothetical protein [Streptomyces massasporeus]GGV91770.1 hypothetical protein GCM10010228_82910 [Streptomyces massasporeus]